MSLKRLETRDQRRETKDRQSAEFEPRFRVPGPWSLVSGPWSLFAPRAFTLIEVLVSVAITAAIAGLIVAIVANVSGFWSRTSGRLSAEAQARYVLDQLTLDLQSALYRDDGNTWLAATIPTSTSNTGLWNTQNTTGNAVKPANAAGSLQFIATGSDGKPSSLSDSSPNGPRFGIAGTWLRFFTTKRGANSTSGNATTTATNTSAPVAVAYQIVRRATSSTTPNNTDRRYLLHRTEVRPAALSTARNGTLQAGFSIVATAYQPSSGTNISAADPAEIKFPTLNSVVAENVIDFGVRMFNYIPDADGKLVLTQIFPANNSDLSHTATLPPRVKNSAGDYTNCFPEVVEVMVRVLTDQGARLLAGYEGSPQSVTAAAGRTAQQYWWDIALANSQVFTRRIVVNAKPL
jgi:prepilin-type N-terminal cleavage/methylation domain-containing protein